MLKNLVSLLSVVLVSMRIDIYVMVNVKASFSISKVILLPFYGLVFKNKLFSIACSKRITSVFKSQASSLENSITVKSLVIYSFITESFES